MGEARQRSFASPHVLVTIKDSRLKESSGVAPSQLDANAFYTHNDSGDSPRFFKFVRSGKILKEYKLRDAKNLDWEDMASATLGGKPYLFIGDIGDNAGRRQSITVYRVAEPTGSKARVDQTYTLTYPDEPHNAETLLVHPSTGDITIVTKASLHPQGIYYLPRPRRSGAYVLKKIGDISIDSNMRAGKLITGGAWSQDGKHVVLRTYFAGYEFPGDDPMHWFEKSFVNVPTNLEFQGEAITYTLDGKALITTSEGSPCPVSEIPIEGS
ncbi:MAG: hypothetical protein QOJ65_1241 [Fimbriimonadaceae bacterium]|jgi:hypothetical protein|nr:hypothetical protein [Fimbriimonadaceae bacterium]